MRPQLLLDLHAEMIVDNFAGGGGASTGIEQALNRCPDIGGGHHALVLGFLMKYYSEGGQDSGLREPMHTITTKDRMALVTVDGCEYGFEDIGMRMLKARELFRGQGFPEAYIIDAKCAGKPLTESDKIRMCGNSVPPPVVAAIVSANVPELAIKS